MPGPILGPAVGPYQTPISAHSSRPVFFAARMRRIALTMVLPMPGPAVMTQHCFSAGPMVSVP